MPTVLDYQTALKQLTAQGFKSLYHNSGAFGLVGETMSRGWVDGDDSTIREAARPLLRQMDRRQMPDRFVSIWRSALPGPVWLMPKSHWAYELEFGNKDWLKPLLEKLGIDTNQLAKQNDGAPIQFEDNAIGDFLTEAMNHLAGSDFLAAFPGRGTVCTIHHHKQLWWTTIDSAVAEAMDRLVPAVV